MTQDTSFTLVLPGKPNTKLRPRFCRNGSKVRTYDSQSEEKNTVKWLIKARMRDRELFSGPIHVKLVFFFKRVKSREKLNETYHSIRPDLDNLIKFILDAGNATLWYDDQQIVSIHAVKKYADKAETVITVTEMDYWN